MTTKLLDNETLPNGHVFELLQMHGRYYIDEWDGEFLILHESFNTEEQARAEFKRHVNARRD